jgi:hypothetical protein
MAEVLVRMKGVENWAINLECLYVRYTFCKVIYRLPSSKINPNQFIQAHTILKNFPHKYSDKSVLVLGGQLNKVREVAERCVALPCPLFGVKLIPSLQVRIQKCLHNTGYTSMESVVRILCQFPTCHSSWLRVWPFHTLSESEQNAAKEWPFSLTAWNNGFIDYL